MRITCEQCGKVFKKATKLACEASMRMHVGRVHGNVKPHDPHAPRAGRKAEPKNDEKRLKRLAYQKEWRKRRKNGGHGSHNGVFTVGFCPRCGMNLEVLATALAIVNKA